MPDKTQDQNIQQNLTELLEKHLAVGKGDWLFLGRNYPAWGWSHWVGGGWSGTSRTSAFLVHLRIPIPLASDHCEPRLGSETVKNNLWVGPEGDQERHFRPFCKALAECNQDIVTTPSAWPWPGTLK